VVAIVDRENPELETSIDRGAESARALTHSCTVSDSAPHNDEVRVSRR
jgi:hypothetical protein